MKLRLFLFVSIAAFTVNSAAAFSNPGDLMAEKRKTYSKSYPVSTSDRIRLENQFGEMKIQTWDKNEVKVDVTIVTKGSTDEIAQKIMDRISIEDGKSGNEVYFKTEMKNQREHWDKKDKNEYKEQSMKIDYMVFLPASSPLDATNQFGPMSLPDYRGPVDLTSKFGSLTTGKLSNVKEVNVEFGKANIEAVNGGRVTIKFSSGEVKNMNGNMSLRVEFCDKLKIGVDNSVKDLDLKTSYSTVYLNASNDLSATYDIRTSFGDFSNKTSFTIKEDRDEDDDRRGPRFDKNFRGNSGSGTNRIKVKSDFGEVILGHNLQVDFSEKDKKKSKSSKVI